MEGSVRTPRPVKLPEKKIQEADVEASVCGYATRRNIYNRKYSTPNHRASPDRIFAIRSHPRPHVFFIEFKAPGKTWTKPQARERDRLQAVGFRVYLCDDAAQGFGIIDEELRLAGAST